MMRPMKTHLFPALLAALCLAFTATAAHAGDLTYPKDSKPAFTFKLPDGWVSNDGAGGNLVIHTANSLGVISLIVVDDADSVKMPIDKFARAVFDGAGIKTIDKQEDAELAGVKGRAYYGVLKPDGTTVVNLKITIIHIDDTHLATLTRACGQGIPDADAAAVDGVIKSAVLVAK